MHEGDFDIYLRTLKGNPFVFNFAPILHSSAVGAGNLTGFGTPASDRLIDRRCGGQPAAKNSAATPVSGPAATRGPAGTAVFSTPANCRPPNANRPERVGPQARLRRHGPRAAQGPARPLTRWRPELLWRLAQTLLAVWLLASAVFLLSRRDAAAAAQLTLPDATELTARTQPATAAGQAALRQQARQRLGLALPLFYVGRGPVQPSWSNTWYWYGIHNQYHEWLRQTLHGQLGSSYRSGQPVGQRLREALTYTVPLTGIAAVLAAVAALGLARAGAGRPRWRRRLRVVLSGLAALPGFVLALALLLLLANPDALAWFPASGLVPALGPPPGFWAALGDYATHLTLPVLALVLAALPGLTLPLADALDDELQTGYATTARAKGASAAQVVGRHALPNALLPFIAQVADLLPSLVAGAVVVEVVFALPGMGRLLATAAAGRDFPVLVGGVWLVGAARLLALLLADALYFWADPRIRWAT